MHISEQILNFQPERAIKPLCFLALLLFKVILIISTLETQYSYNISANPQLSCKSRRSQTHTNAQSKKYLKNSNIVINVELQDA